MLMSSLVRYSLSALPEMESTTWVFTGTQWNAVPSAKAVPPLGGGNGILVYDSARNREVLVVGSSEMMVGTSPAEGTWDWDGYTWERRMTTHSLAIFTQWASAAYSPDLRAIVLIDTNLSGASFTGQTWLFNGTDWRSQTTAHWPDSRAHLEYDPARHVIVALSLSSYRMWEFDGRDWVPITPDGAGGPLVGTGMGRQAPAATYDPQRNRWIVFGGSDGTSAFADTWTGDGITWKKELPIKAPPGRAGASMAWDASHGRVVLFGGDGGISTGPDLGDTWSWDGNNWTQLAGPTTQS
jgi:hypothetical protein